VVDPILQIVSTLPAAPDGACNAGRLLRDLRPAIAAAGLVVRFNMLTRAIELDGTEIPEHTVELAHTRFQEADWLVGKNDAIDALIVLARENSYHPVAEYLDRIEHDDTIPYFDLDAVATTFLGTTDPLYDRMMKVALIGAVRRIREPACQHDTVVVFQGRQGARKTRFWKALASEDWYSPCTTGREVEMLMVMHRAWIVEFGELESITSRHEIGALRTLITTTRDPFRVPYGRSPAMHERRFLLVGTVNPAGFLNDPEGHRRFHCIPVPEGFLIDVELVAAFRDSIWKAAALSHAAGELSFLSDGDQDESNRRNTIDHVMESAWDGPITQWAESQIEGTPFTTAQVLTGSEVRDKGHIQPADHGRVVQILKTLGWTRHPTKARKAWMPPCTTK
jgi:predicted P-loop ATPase